MTPIEVLAVAALTLTWVLVSALAIAFAVCEGGPVGMLSLSGALLAPLVALLLDAPLGLSLASASSPWRIGVALLCLSLAFLGAWQERLERGRPFWACVLAVGWNAADVLAPFTWLLRGPYIGSLLCLGACFAVWLVLLAPKPRRPPWTICG